MGETGATFAALYAYVLRFLPKIVIMENVEGLTKRCQGQSRQIDFARSAFEQAGYSFEWTMLDT
eukprot:9744020-Prorocentrum_lima.AAC.1